MHRKIGESRSGVSWTVLVIFGRGLKGLFRNYGWELASVLCVSKRIYAIELDRIRKEMDIADVYLYYDLETEEVLAVPEECERDIWKDRRGNSIGYGVSVMPAI